MKTMKNALCALLLPLLFAGCVAEIDNLQKQEDLHEVVFHAGWDPETKTVLQEDGSVWWSPGDEISLFVGEGDNGGYKLTFTNTVSASTVDFIGQIGDNPNNAAYMAVYPYDENAYCTEDGWVYTSIPEIQYAKPATFSNGQLVSIAKANGDYLFFHNICGGIKFSVANEGISKVVFSNCYHALSDLEYPVAGKCAAFLADDGTVFTGISEGASAITVLPLEGESFIPGKYYYVAMSPVELPQLEVTFYKRNDTFATFVIDNWEVAGGNWPTIKRATVRRLTEIDKDLSFISCENTYAILGGNDIWPNEIDRTAITEINFHTNCETIHGIAVRSSLGHGGYYPAYVEKNGTVIDFYTEADYYMLRDGGSLFYNFQSLKNLDLSMLRTDFVTNLTGMFQDCRRLESLDLSSFNTEKVKNMHTMFQNCKSLRSLNLSSFSSSSMEGEPQGADCLFNHCYDLVKLDLGRFDLSVCGTSHAMVWLSKYSKNCAIRCSSATRAKLSDDESRLGASAEYITWVLPEEDIPDLEPIVDPTLYTSTDYSKDKTVRVLHQATKGKGVDIVLLGDAYSDRMIADGTYDADMELAMNAILKDEPYASFKDYFNVYTVYAVSKNEIPFDTPTVFDASINHYDPVNGVVAYSENDEVYRYASIAVPDKDLEDVAMILIINQAEGEGDSWTDGVAGYEGGWSEEEYLDYAAHAKSIGMINRRNRSQTETFSQIVAHEFGHVFAKLGDEYIMIDGEIADWEREFIIDSSTHVGWWSNLDVTSDPKLIKWKRFMEDERYAGTGIGIYDGGYTYALGVWHPTENSIMRSNQGMFNAPSREVIYKRIHKLALGKDWEYDFETFVEYDQKNIAAEKAAKTVSKVKSIDSPHPKPFFKMEESVSADGKKTVTIIMN